MAYLSFLLLRHSSTVRKKENQFLIIIINATRILYMHIMLSPSRHKKLANNIHLIKQEGEKEREKQIGEKEEDENVGGGTVIIFCSSSSAPSLYFFFAILMNKFPSSITSAPERFQNLPLSTPTPQIFLGNKNKNLLFSPHRPCIYPTSNYIVIPKHEENSFMFFHECLYVATDDDHR